MKNNDYTIRLLIAAFALWLTGHPTLSRAHEESNPGQPLTISEEHAYTLGTTAYLWAFPMMDLYRVRDGSIKGYGGPNKFSHTKGLFNAEISKKLGVVSANNAPSIL